MSDEQQSRKLNFIEKWLIWLSAADSEILQREECPKWERLKYEAFGASLLVPFLFGMVAASYAVSTLTDSWFIIVGFALVWGFIIITIDRVLLATYRAFISFPKKILQFCLRVTVAVLMGLTVSHPLVLMLFADAINSEIEKGRAAEMAEARGATDAQKNDVNNRIQKATENLQALQSRYNEVIGGSFLNAENPVQAETPEDKQQKNQFSDIDGQISEYKRERDQVQADLNRWQKVYDDEISGARSGNAGIGPNARAIERDEIVWRRDQLRDLNKTIGDLTARRTQMSSELLAQSAKENAEIQRSRRELEQQKLEMFKSQQSDLLAVIKGQIDSASGELNRLRRESEQITENTIDRVDALKDERRLGLMAQTDGLHHMFKKDSGQFALVVYVVITALFTLIDTIPLVVKFFAPPGIYDYIQKDKESQESVREGQEAAKIRKREEDDTIRKRKREEERLKTLHSREESLRVFSEREIHAPVDRSQLVNQIFDDAANSAELASSDDELNDIFDLAEKKAKMIATIGKVQAKLQHEVNTSQALLAEVGRELPQKTLPLDAEFTEIDSEDLEKDKEKVAEIIRESDSNDSSTPPNVVQGIDFVHPDEATGEDDDPGIPEPRKQEPKTVEAKPQVIINKGEKGEGLKITGTNPINLKNGAQKNGNGSKPNGTNGHSVAAPNQYPVPQQPEPAKVEQPEVSQPAPAAVSNPAASVMATKPATQQSAVSQQTPATPAAAPAAQPAAKNGGLTASSADVQSQTQTVTEPTARPTAPTSKTGNIEMKSSKPAAKKVPAPPVKKDDQLDLAKVARDKQLPPRNDLIDKPEDGGFGAFLKTEDTSNRGGKLITGSAFSPRDMTKMAGAGGMALKPTQGGGEAAENQG